MKRAGFLREIKLLRDEVSDFSCYPFDIPAVESLETLALDPEVTFFIGENGSGKSTLIEAIAIGAGLNPEGGSQNFAYSEQATESVLCESLRIIRNPIRARSAFFLRAETMFNVATQVQRQELFEYGWQDIHAKSHGEAFLWTVQNRFHGNGLYVLDEPESALSPGRQIALIRMLHDLIRAGSQFIIATHSPILMAYPGATIYALSDAGISEVNYQDTDHYRVSKSFLENPEAFLNSLLADPD